MTVTLTDEALAVIKRSLELSTEVEKPGVRIREAGGAIRPRFAAEPSPGDETVVIDDVRVFVAESIAARGDIVIDVSPEHETLVVRHG